MKKFNFNMVEIALAMVIIAFGISGILGLFTVGVNAKKEAMNENNIADAAEYILGTYKALILSRIHENADANAANILKAGKLADLANKVGDDKLENTLTVYEPSDDGVKKFSVSSKDTHIYHKSEEEVPRVFSYMPTRTVDGVEVPVCRIIGRVWAENVPFHYRDWSDGNVKSNYSGNTPVPGGDFYDSGFAMRLYLELSWPAEKKYEDREKRVFVMDITNPRKELSTI